MTQTHKDSRSDLMRDVAKVSHGDGCNRDKGRLGFPLAGWFRFRWARFETLVSGVCLAVVPALLVSGCGGGAPSTPPPGSIAITAPSNGATVKALPYTVTLSLTNTTSLTGAHVTLNGDDITSSFAVSGQTATATVSKGTYLGSNRLKATLGST